MSGSTSDRGTIALKLDAAWFDLAEFRRVAADADADAGRWPRRSTCTAATCCRASPSATAPSSTTGSGSRPTACAASWPPRSTGWSKRWRPPARFDEAVARAEQRLALDPLHEPAHRRLIELYASAGRRGDALAQYRECVRTLDRELGVGPLAETTELYNAVNEGRERRSR